MNKNVDKYLLKKYAIPWNYYGISELERRILCEILYRLNKNKKLDNIDKQWIREHALLHLYKYIEDLEEARVDKESLYRLHYSCLFPYEEFMAPPLHDYLDARRYLFDVYAIPATEFKIEERHDLYYILHRLYTNEKLDYTHMQWIQDNGSSKLYKFVENWKKTGDPDLYFLRNTHSKLQKNDLNNCDKATENTPNPSNRQRKNNNIKHLRKPHMPLHIKEKVLENHIKEHIKGIVPSKIPKEISSLFPLVIWNNMDDHIQKDIKELFKVYQIQQWTPTTLMASRLLEKILQVHVESHLKEDPVKNMGEAIEKLKKHYDDIDLFKDLNIYRIKRNNYMHGQERASSSKAQESVDFVISMTTQIYNINIKPA